MHRLVRQAQRWLYLIHRWIGIATCLLIAIWFFSGVVMMYVAFPGLTDKERRTYLPAIDWQEVRLTPEQALAVAGQSSWPHSIRLEMLGDDPVYRIMPWDHSRLVVSAKDGRLIVGWTEENAVAAVSRAAGRPVTALEPAYRDQWTVFYRFDSLRPFHRIALNDDKNTILYLSSKTGEIALDTSRSERFWNWLGAIPHWIYLTPIRAANELWRQLLLWTSGISGIVAVSGIWIGIQRLRIRRKYARGTMSPYRGWMLWHHWAGVIGSVFLMLWLFSGWISVNPNSWFQRPSTDQGSLIAYGGNPGTAFPASPNPAGKIVEARFLWVGGNPVTIFYRADGSTLPSRFVNQNVIVDAARNLLPQAEITKARLIEAADSYWYSHHHERPLPVLRIEFDDPDGTWFHIAPGTGDILQRTNSNQRLYRWLFNAMHSFDIRVLIANRPAWDVLLWAMSAVGFVMSVSGVVIGWRRLRRKASRSGVRTPQCQPHNF